MMDMTTPAFISPSTDDADLVERSLGGDTKAFGSIVERTSIPDVRTGLQRIRQCARDEDFAQEIFITAWRQLRTLHEKSNVRGWLCGIARNVIHGFLRSQQRTPAAKAAELDAALETTSAEPSPVKSAINE